VRINVLTGLVAQTGTVMLIYLDHACFAEQRAGRRNGQ
jgi:hypothetical protein